MEGDAIAVFRDYLRGLPDELLQSVTEDYIWLASQIVIPEKSGTEFADRRECCREECLRRGEPEIYLRAAGEMKPHAA
ncbi:MAG TPA: hypothetical protein VG675_20085 [Bryobacteraceae bacterium]|nr:hypothetical protein [Bryobacteraceae bacterium]